MVLLGEKSLNNKINEIAKLLYNVKKDKNGDLYVVIKKHHPLYDVLIENCKHQIINPETPEELYARSPEYSTNDVTSYLWGCYYNHVPEIYNNFGDSINQTKIKIHVYKEFDFDGRRIWRLAAVSFKDEFVMIIQNAGREGDDHAERFITNIDAYQKMVKYLKDILNVIEFDMEEIKKDCVDINDNIPNLSKFYGNELDGYFERY